MKVNNTQPGSPLKSQTRCTTTTYEKPTRNLRVPRETYEYHEKPTRNLRVPRETYEKPTRNLRVPRETYEKKSKKSKSQKVKNCRFFIKVLLRAKSDP